MIATNFELLKPASIDEAIEARNARNGRAGLYYLAGGTEIVTMSRDGVMEPTVVIDLKEIPELRRVERDGDRLVIGACVTLNAVAEWNAFPLLSAAALGVADRTVRNSITVGGNIAGRLPYREAILPFLVCGATAQIAGPNGQREAALTELFDKRLKLEKGEFLVSLSVTREAAEAPSFYRRKTKDSRIDYPIMALSAAKFDSGIAFACSGVYSYPLRSVAAEKALAGASGGPGAKAEAAVAAAGMEPKSDMRAGADYRRMLLVRALSDAIEELS